MQGGEIWSEQRERQSSSSRQVHECVLTSLPGAMGASHCLPNPLQNNENRS